MIDGYIKWYRKAERNPALRCKRFDELHAWLWLVERANYKRVKIRFNGGYKTLQRGQLWKSIRELAHTWGWGKNRVTSFLDLLEANKMIRRVSDANGTLLTIEKYSDYQDTRDTNKDTNEDTNEDANGPQKNENKGGHGQHRSDDRASVPNNDPRYMEIAMGEPDEFIIDRDI